MATYASSSNPFIKTNNNSSLDGGDSSPTAEVPKRKAVPGMAMPQSQMTDRRKHRDGEISTSTLTHTTLTTSSNESSSLDPKVPEGLESDNGKSAEVDVVVDLNSKSDGDLERFEKEDSVSDFDEITKACENLVETTIKLELEEVASRKTCLGEDNKEAHAHPKCSMNPAIKPQKAIELDLETEDADNGAFDDEQQVEPDSGRRQHIELIKKLRLQLRDLERYAYERGELGQVPASVIAERQTVILDTLKERLSLSIDINEIEKLELDELKKQVDKEMHDLIDPLITKDHLLGQLKTQLTDLERYISYLHGTIGKIHDKSTCTCHVHGCCASKMAEIDNNGNLTTNSTSIENGNKTSNNEFGLMDSDTLPKTSKLIRSLVTQLICSDLKLRESAKKAEILEQQSKCSQNSSKQSLSGGLNVLSKSPPKSQDDAAWTLHIDKVILATDSLVNLFTTEPKYQRVSDNNNIDDRLVESIVRRQLVPALRDLLSYGLIDRSSMPRSTSYVSLLFDPYYLLTSLTCFPSSSRDSSPVGGDKNTLDKIHLWNVIEEYYDTRNDPSFKTSSVKTLSQSFDLAPSISGPIKITSKQALLIAIEDINETLSRSKPNGPESHLRAFIYTALNRAKLATWMRIIFRNKSIIKRFYHNFSFTSQPEKMDKLLSTIEPLSQLSFKLRTDVESIEQFVSAF